MKKFILSVIIITAFSYSSFSQLTIKPAFGFNVSRLSTDEGNWSSEARAGFQFGGTVMFGNKLYVEPGIFWTTMSSEMVHKDNVNYNFDHKIGMIRVPVFVGYHLVGNASESLFNLRVFAGPSASFITSVEESVGLLKDDFSSVLWGVDAGVGINVWWLFLDMGYEWGLNDIYSHDALGSAKTSAFWSNLGIRIRL